jgi:hypothetical protein
MYVGWPLEHTNNDQPVLTANVWRVAVKRLVRWFTVTSGPSRAVLDQTRLKLNEGYLDHARRQADWEN